MSAPTAPASAPQPDAELEATLAAVEARLTALGVALLESNAPEIDTQASELHRALARAVEHFSHAARNGALPAPLRARLMRAGSQVAAQRESFARATAALDRAIDVLFPSEAPRLYSAQGANERSRRGGSIQA